MKHWKRNLLIVSLFSILTVTLLTVFDGYKEVFKGCLFFSLLLIASYSDIKTRTIPDIIHILIMIVGLINIDIVDSMLGFIIVLPFFIMAYVKEGSIGGGDVKLMGACGFLLGVSEGIFAACLGLILFILINCGKTTKKFRLSIPLGPYLSLGLAISKFIS